MSRRKKLILCLALLALVLAPPAAFLYRHLKPWETTNTTYASWRGGGQPGALRVTVRDRAGNPVPGAVVAITNNSGGVGDHPTDAAGVAVLWPGESELEAMWVNGHKVIDRPYALFLGRPKAYGLVVDVVLGG